jgi:hypothetical protein
LVFGEGCREDTARHLFAEHHVGRTQPEVGRAGAVSVFADERLRGLYAGRALLIDVEEDPLAEGPPPKWSSASSAASMRAGRWYRWPVDQRFRDP